MTPCYRLVLLAFLKCILTVSVAYRWPNYNMDELEHLLVDGGGFNEGGVKAAITPCSNYVSGSQLLGRETAAQWIRVAFHDFATANVSAGTGGIDASIGFETLRSENSGAAMNDTIGFFSSFVNAHVSMADLISLSVAISVGGCSSPTISIPLRGGRIDATQGGAFGVPEAESSLHVTLERFEVAGFNQREAIALTACGHTLGSVHHGGFPQVVPASAVTPNNTAGGVHFDATVDVFDINVVTEYLDGTGQRGGPLVTTDNVTVQSDLRLYASDNNATMRELSTSSSHFASTCIDLLTRMINTVPAVVTLTDPIVPNIVKPVGISLTLDDSGNVMFTGYIRLLSPGHSKNSVITILWETRSGYPARPCSVKGDLTQSGTSIFGTTYYHSFSASIDPRAGISRFSILVKDGSETTKYTNGGGGYAVQDTVIWLPGDSEISTTTVSVSAAVLTNLSPKSVNAVLSVPTPQNGTLSPTIVTLTTALAKDGQRGLYTLYTGLATLPLTEGNRNQASVDIVVVTPAGVIKDEFRRLALVKESVVFR